MLLLLSVITVMIIILILMMMMMMMMVMIQRILRKGWFENVLCNQQDRIMIGVAMKWSEQQGIPV